MSALAVPVPTPATRRARPTGPRRRGHLELVGPGFVPAPAAPAPLPARPATRPALRLTARGRLLRSVAVLVLGTGAAVGAGAWLGSAVGTGAEYEGPTTTVSVAPGQTLWQIAASSATGGQDVREVVEQIQGLNGLSSAGLAVGQQLLVPAG